MTENNAAHASTQELQDAAAMRKDDQLDQLQTRVLPGMQTVIEDKDGMVARVLNAAPRSPKEFVVSLMTTATISSEQLSKVLGEFGGFICSHDMSTLEGVQVATRLLGKGDKRLSDMMDKETFTVDSWLLAAVNLTKPDGEVSDFLAVTLGSGDKVIRFASRWARVTLGMAMQYFLNREWEPIVLRVNRSPLVVGQMITLQFQGLANPHTETHTDGKTRKASQARPKA